MEKGSKVRIVVITLILAVLVGGYFLLSTSVQQPETQGVAPSFQKAVESFITFRKNSPELIKQELDNYRNAQRVLYDSLSPQAKDALRKFGLRSPNLPDGARQELQTYAQAQQGLRTNLSPEAKVNLSQQRQMYKSLPPDAKKYLGENREMLK